MSSGVKSLPSPAARLRAISPAGVPDSALSRGVVPVVHEPTPLDDNHAPDCTDPDPDAVRVAVGAFTQSQSAVAAESNLTQAFETVQLENRDASPTLAIDRILPVQEPHLYHPDEPASSQLRIRPTFDPGSFNEIFTSTALAHSGPLTPFAVEPGESDTLYPVEIVVEDSTVDLCFEDDSFSSLEKIYLFSRSKKLFHRSYMARNLAFYLETITPPEAVEYVLPLLPELAVDESDSVPEALASDLISILAWLFSHCHAVDDSQTPDYENAEFSFQDIVAILLALLTSPIPVVASEARRTVVELINFSWLDKCVGHALDLAQTQKDFIREELIQQVVLGMGRWDQEGAPPPVESASEGQPEHIPPPPQSPETVSEASTSPPEQRHQECVDAADPAYSGPPSGSLSHEPEDAQDLASTLSEDYSQETTLGKLASMSLIAAISANDRNTLTAIDKQQFVEEVQRISQDTLFWVRSEAAFAMGALAKVVPDELAQTILIPLFSEFTQDINWKVRHSAIFALPNFLDRLPSTRRRVWAIPIIQRLAKDNVADVRSGVLEILGETIHKFGQEGEPPPQELLQLFLEAPSPPESQPEARRPPVHDTPESVPIEPSGALEFVAAQLAGAGKSLRSLFERKTDNYKRVGFEEAAQASDVPHRALICAYNYPAVILTTGRNMWNGRLREYYLELLRDQSYKVRHTLTASLGEVSRIIGPQHSKADLLDFWRQRLSDDDSSIRLLALQQIPIFSVDLISFSEFRMILETLPILWTRRMHGWRERLFLVDSLQYFFDHVDAVARELLHHALRDPVAAIRERVIEKLPHLSTSLVRASPVIWDAIKQDIYSLASGQAYRHRSTFVNCYRTLTFLVPDDFDYREWLPLIRVLAQDPVVGVRIGVSRLVGIMCEKIYPNPHDWPDVFLQTIERLRKDSDRDVRSYIAFVFSGNTARSPITVEPIPPTPPPLAEFSKPPATSPLTEETSDRKKPPRLLPGDPSESALSQELSRGSPLSLTSAGSASTMDTRSFDSYFAYKPTEMPADHWWALSNAKEDIEPPIAAEQEVHDQPWPASDRKDHEVLEVSPDRTLVEGMGAEGQIRQMTDGDGTGTAGVG